jgi:hypothetical protein
MLREARFRKTKTSYMQKVDPKDKHIHKNKHDHIHIYRSNTLVIVESHNRTQGKMERKRG